MTPLIEPAMEIINRTHLKLMAPNIKYGKQRYNMALKQLLKLCGITRPVSIYNHPCQGTGTWHQRPNALEKTGSFPGRLLFFNAFLLFFARFVWK